MGRETGAGGWEKPGQPAEAVAAEAAASRAARRPHAPPPDRAPRRRARCRSEDATGRRLESHDYARREVARGRPRTPPRKVKPATAQIPPGAAPRAPAARAPEARSASLRIADRAATKLIPRSRGPRERASTRAIDSADPRPGARADPEHEARGLNRRGGEGRSARLPDGLSQYERERLGRIARNEAFMQSLGLGGEGGRERRARGAARAAARARARAGGARAAVAAPRGRAGARRRHAVDGGFRYLVYAATRWPPTPAVGVVGRRALPRAGRRRRRLGRGRDDRAADDRLKMDDAVAAAGASSPRRAPARPCRPSAAARAMRRLASFKAHGGWVGGCGFVGFG